MVVNTIILLFAYISTIMFFKRWIKSKSFKNVTLTPELMKKISIRTFLLYAFFGYICWYFQLNAFKLFVIICVFSLIFLFAGSGFGSIGLLAGIPIVIYYVLFQWILGFPDKELWIPSNKPYEHPTPKLTHLIGQTGQTETPLRPIGEIVIQGQKYTAASDFGFIEKGKSVTVTAIRNSNLVVSTKDDS